MNWSTFAVSVHAANSYYHHASVQHVCRYVVKLLQETNVTKPLLLIVIKEINPHGQKSSDWPPTQASQGKVMRIYKFLVFLKLSPA